MGAILWDWALNLWDLQVDSVRTVLNCRAPSCCQGELLGSVLCKREGKTHRRWRTGFFPTQEQKTRFFYSGLKSNGQGNRSRTVESKLNWQFKVWCLTNVFVSLNQELSDQGNYCVNGRHLLSMHSHSSGTCLLWVAGLAPSPCASLLWGIFMGGPRRIRLSGPWDQGLNFSSAPESPGASHFSAEPPFNLKPKMQTS